MSSPNRILDQLMPSILLGVTMVVTLVAAIVAIEIGYDVPLFTKGAFRFERPWAALLMIGPLLVFVAQSGLYRRRGTRLAISRASELGAMPRGFRATFSSLPVALRVAALTLAVLALMGPQSIHAREDDEVEGIDLVLVLDVSLSMEATDVAPNRFAATQHVVSDFVARRPNDRIGAVVFGRDAYTLMPLTTDHEALQNVIADLQLGIVDGRGTAIGNGLGVGLNRLRRSTARSKVVILLTDGDSNAGNLAPDQGAELAASMRVKVYTVLMGLSDDASHQTGVDLFGQPVFQRGRYLVNPELLQRIARRTGGEHFNVGDRASLERTFHTILDRLERSRIADAGRVYGELYPALVLPALALLALEVLLATLVFRRWP